MARARVMDPRGAMVRSCGVIPLLLRRTVARFTPLCIQLSRINRNRSRFLRLPQRKILVSILLIQP